MMQVFLILLAMAVLMPQLAPAQPPGSAGPGEAGPGVAAMVNGVAIPERLLAAEVKEQLDRYSRYGMRQANPELTATLRRQGLDRLIDRELLRQASSRVVVGDAEEQARRKLSAMQAGFKSPEKFAKYLASRQLTPEKFIDSYRTQLQMDAYLASQGLTGGEPSEEEIAAYYERTKENFKREETVRVRHILIAVAPDAAAQEKEQARLLAEELHSRLAEDSGRFPLLAARYSGCARSKNKDGELGLIKRGFMPPEFDAAAFALQPGEISGVVVTQYGFHIIQVTDRKPAGYAPLAEVHDFISRYLQGDLTAKKMAAHIGELRKQAVIEVFSN